MELELFPQATPKVFWLVVVVFCCFFFDRLEDDDDDDDALLQEFKLIFDDGLEGGKGREGIVCIYQIGRAHV